MIDDILGLMILTVVVGVTEGKEISLWGVVMTAGSAFGFLVATILVGKLVVPVLFRWGSRIELPGTATGMALMTAFGLAWLAKQCGSENYHRRVRRGIAGRFSPASPRDRARNY